MYRYLKDFMLKKDGLWNQYQIPGAPLHKGSGHSLHKLSFMSNDVRERYLKKDYTQYCGDIKGIAMDFVGKESVGESIRLSSVVTILNCMNAWHWGGGRAYEGRKDTYKGSQEEALIDKIRAYAALPFYGDQIRERRLEKGYFSKDQHGVFTQFREDVARQRPEIPSTGYANYLHMPASLFGPFSWEAPEDVHTGLNIVAVHAPDFRRRTGSQNIEFASTPEGNKVFAQMVRFQLAAAVEKHLQVMNKKTGLDNSLVLPILGCGAFQGNEQWYAEQYYYVLAQYADQLEQHKTKVHFPWSHESLFQKQLQALVNGTVKPGLTGELHPANRCTMASAAQSSSMIYWVLAAVVLGPVAYAFGAPWWAAGILAVVVLLIGSEVTADVPEIPAAPTAPRVSSVPKTPGEYICDTVLEPLAARTELCSPAIDPHHKHADYLISRHGTR